VGCQDEFIKYRYYLVNGRNGHFPPGTRCSPVGKRYCVNGKCLEFGDDDLPLEKIHISLGQMRTRRRRSLPFNDIFNLTEINSTAPLALRHRDACALPSEGGQERWLQWGLVKANGSTVRQPAAV